MMQPLVSFGIVNCNRLHYLRSNVESLLVSVADYKNIELIIVDNASIETGTDDYLNELRERGHHVHKTTARDPSNEYAAALNYIVQHAKGEYICPLAGDMQFILVGGWLQSYVNFHEDERFKNNIGCISLDAQRRITHESHSMSSPYGEDEIKFLFDSDRPPIATSANAFFSRKVLNMMGPWSTQNKNHEGGDDSETKMLANIRQVCTTLSLNLYTVLPMIPPAAAIYTDPRGTMARIRNNNRYGLYFSAKDSTGYKYYEMIDVRYINSRFFETVHRPRRIPVSIEAIASPIGYEKPVDEYGNWKKNPIRPDSPDSQCQPVS